MNKTIIIIALTLLLLTSIVTANEKIPEDPINNTQIIHNKIINRVNNNYGWRPINVILNPTINMTLNRWNPQFNPRQLHFRIHSNHKAIKIQHNNGYWYTLIMKTSSYNRLIK